MVDSATLAHRLNIKLVENEYLFGWGKAFVDVNLRKL